MATIRIQSRPILPKNYLRTHTGLAVLVDENTRLYCYEKVKSQLPPHTLIELPAGERHKNLATCQQVWKHLINAGLDRHCLLIVLGGGVLGDLGGFCASTYKRGVDFLLVPTTLLAMADASIGGKTGVDFDSLKNQIGTFKMPLATYVATDFLRTLPAAELRSGFAEIIKHALIGDRMQWNVIRRKALNQQEWQKLLRFSVNFKSRIVIKDPLERGIRKILNYGHTLGHALEACVLESGGAVLHGDAIAAGMVMEAHIGFEKKLLSHEDLGQIRDYVLQIFGKMQLPSLDRLMPAVRQDKKNKGNEILVALPKSIGKAVYDIPVTEQEIRNAIGFYQT